MSIHQKILHKIHNVDADLHSSAETESAWLLQKVRKILNTTEESMGNEQKIRELNGRLIYLATLTATVGGILTGDKESQTPA